MGIVGIGNLGGALLKHKNFPMRGFHFVAAFDSDPDKVGNQQRTVVSELSGKRNITYIAEKMGVKLAPRAPETRALLQKVKQLESQGFQYENAEASFGRPST